VNILLENIKNSSNELFSFHMTSPANDREEPRTPNQDAGWERLRALLAAGSAVLYSLAKEHLCPSQHWSHAGLGRVPSSRAKLEIDSSSATGEVFQCPGRICELTAKLSNVSQTDLVVSCFMKCLLGFFFCFR